ncbi:MAG: antirestriction protein ArdA [Clostridia bacterium]|nr:antirestriction protein ArdA [Clostridia bacterium]
MFKIQTSYHDTRVEIEFPCSNNMLYAKLAELHIPDEKKVTAQLFIEEIDYEELKCLKNTFVDPDILNYIAQKMDSFDSKELKKFDAVVNTHSLSSPRDLVNLTFNMHYYTLIEDLSDLEKVGKTHMLTRCQALTTDNKEGYDFYKIGKDLIASDTGKMTQYGILFVNDDLPYEKPYLGVSLPSFEYDSDKFITLQLIYEDKSAYVYLPDSPFGIERAVHRIGAESITDCKVYVDKYSFDDGHQTILSNVLKNEGVYALNNLSLELSKLDKHELYDLQAIIEYAEVSDSESVIKLAQNVDCFIVYDEAENNEELAREWIDGVDEYYINTDLQDFFDYEEYGKYIFNNLNGRFIEGSGFVGIKEGNSISKILDINEEQGMQGMSGM